MHEGPEGTLPDEVGHRGRCGRGRVEAGIGHNGERRQRRVRRAGGKRQLRPAQSGPRRWRGAAVRIETEARIAGILGEQEEEAGLVVSLGGRTDSLGRRHAGKAGIQHVLADAAAKRGPPQLRGIGDR